ncbi:MAG: NFYB/HAP3 family transcription factor subunit [Theionarchaea archaeon]|nr:NFYB/HAP3 family transcription factor subunit [Theionarchaea archaeon]
MLENVAKKLIKKAGAERVSAEAAKKMASSLEEKAVEIAQEAITFANREGRETLEIEDMNRALLNRSYTPEQRKRIPDIPKESRFGPLVVIKLPIIPKDIPPMSGGPRKGPLVVVISKTLTDMPNKEGVYEVSGIPAKKLSDHLGSYCIEVGGEALILARHAGRNIVKSEDILLATNMISRKKTTKITFPR